MALAVAPLGVSLNNQFFRPNVNGLIEFSLAYPNMRITCRKSHPRFLYREEELSLTGSVLFVFKFEDREGK